MIVGPGKIQGIKTAKSATGQDRLYFYLSAFNPIPFVQVKWRVWIDLNLNDSFEPWEVVLENASNQPFAGTVFLPFGLQYDTPYRIRVAASWFDYPEPCGEVSFGEVEDYAFIIPGPPPCQNILQIQDQDVQGSISSGQLIQTSGDVQVLWNTKFRSKEVELGPGFEVPAGQSFETLNDPCN